jgi:hypothetical protein
VKRAVAREIDETVPEPNRPSLTVLPVKPPSRLGRPVTIGVSVEVVTLVAVMVTLATNQFSLIAYGLAVLGIVTPLALVTWGFLRLAQDEARSRAVMRSKEQATLLMTTKHGQPPLGHAPKAA